MLASYFSEGLSPATSEHLLPSPKAGIALGQLSGKFKLLY